MTKKHGDHLSSKPRPAALLRKVFRRVERLEGNFVDRMEAFMQLAAFGKDEGGALVAMLCESTGLSPHKATEAA